MEKTLAAERQRAVQLARQADNLKDLIAGLEKGMDAATRARRAAIRADEEKKALDRRPDLAALKDAGRLTPAVAFASARGLLPLPVNGVRVREYRCSGRSRWHGKGPFHRHPARSAGHGSLRWLGCLRRCVP